MKKGEISTSFLIGIVLTLIGGILLILVFTSFNWLGNTEEQVCKSSVILRGTVPEIAKSYTSLNCKIEKICITSGGLFSPDKCEELFPGVEKIKKEKISSKKFISETELDAKTEIEKIIAKKTVECWDMMGAGKISIENGQMAEAYGLGETTSFCVICSRIDIDPNILEDYKINEEELAKINPFEYMKTRKYPETKGSYLDYIIGSGSNGRGAAFGGDYTSQAISKFDESTKEAYQNKEKKFEQLAIVFSQASSPETGEVWTNYLNTALIGGIGLYKTAPGILSTASGIITAKAAGIAAGVFALAAGAIQMNVWNNQALTASYCGDLTHSNGVRKGCSVVRVVKYDATELTQYCGIIDGLP